MKKALVVGIDDYPTTALQGCVNDAVAIANTLEKNGDGSPNFSIKLLTSNSKKVSSEVLSESISSLFKDEADIALFYFAGHGIINQDTNAGYIVSQNGAKGSWGFPLSELLGLANKSYPRIKAVVIILDCCHSGFIGEINALVSEHVAPIGKGVTILTACLRDGTASESNGHGLFTNILLDALGGGSADILGRITPASVYSHIDQTLGPWEQRPVYMANVKTFVTLRKISPKIPLEVLRRLPEYFPDVTSIFPLDPSFEPDRKYVSADLKNVTTNKANAVIFKELQICNRHCLVVPIEEEHMFHAAIKSTGCKLTAIGEHFHKLAKMGRI